MEKSKSKKIQCFSSLGKIGLILNYNFIGMSQNRRKFLSIAALASGAMSLSGNLFAANRLKEEEYDLPSSIRDLKPMVDGIVPNQH